MKISQQAFENCKKRPHAEVRKENKGKAVLYREVWLEMAQSLYRVQLCEDWKKWGFKSFEEYVEKELKLDAREVRYWKAIYKTFILTLGMDGERLKGMHWSKLRYLVPVVNAKNVETWLARAEKLTQTQLEEAVGEARAGREPDDDVKMDRFKCPVTEDEKRTIEAALEAAKKIAPTGNERLGHLLEMVCLDFMGDHPDTRKEAYASMIARIEQVWHIKLLAIDKEDPNWKNVFEKARDVIRGSKVKVS